MRVRMRGVGSQGFLALCTWRLTLGGQPLAGLFRSIPRVLIPCQISVCDSFHPFIPTDFQPYSFIPTSQGLGCDHPPRGAERRRRFRLVADWRPVLEPTRVYWVSQAPHARRSETCRPLVVIPPRVYPFPEVYLDLLGGGLARKIFC